MRMTFGSSSSEEDDGAYTAQQKTGMKSIREWATTHQWVNELSFCTARTEIPQELRVQINIDGVLMAKASGSQFWPILGMVMGFLTVTPS